MIRDVILPLTSAFVALIAAYFALKRNDVPFDENAPSIGDAPEYHILSNHVAIYKLANPNRRAGWCAVIAALLSAAAPLWLLIQKLI